MKRFTLLALCALLLLQPMHILAQEEETSMKPAMSILFFDQTPYRFGSIQHGDCSLIRFPNGQTMLIDCGVPIMGEHVADWLKGMAIDHLDYFLATHVHNDHVGGLKSLLMSGISVDQIISSGYGRRNPDAYHDYYTLLRRKGYTETIVRAGDTMKIGDVNIEFFWPLPSLEEPDAEEVASYHGSDAAEKLNMYSLVFRVSYGNFSILHTGDITKYITEPTLIQQQGEKLRSTVLKIPHHGTDISSSDGFLDAVQPLAAVVMNWHMSMTVQERITARDILLYCTYMAGNITMDTDGETLRIACDLGERTFPLPEENAPAKPE